jgi:hypothetical protein
MAAASKVWSWLARPRNRSVLALLGAGLAAIVAAGWQLYLHATPGPAAAPPSVVVQLQTPQPQAPATTAAAPDAAAARNLQASVNRAAIDEANAIDNISRQIEAANPPPRPAGQRP